MLLILFILDVLCGDIMLGEGCYGRSGASELKICHCPCRQPVEGKLLFASVGMVL